MLVALLPGWGFAEMFRFRMKRAGLGDALSPVQYRKLYYGLGVRALWMPIPPADDLKCLPDVAGSIDGMWYVLSTYEAKVRNAYENHE